MRLPIMSILPLSSTTLLLSTGCPGARSYVSTKPDHRVGARPAVAALSDFVRFVRFACWPRSTSLTFPDSFPFPLLPNAAATGAEVDGIIKISRSSVQPTDDDRRMSKSYTKRHTVSTQVFDEYHPPHRHRNYSNDGRTPTHMEMIKANAQPHRRSPISHI
uniref:Putative secreted protein n=1 Tax=Anopheles marajoara TaxID=58244 RepID=A0A2M4C6A3_9DIPT